MRALHPGRVRLITRFGRGVLTQRTTTIEDIQRSDTVAARLERAIVRFRVQAAHNLLDEALGASAPDVVARELVLPLFESIEETGDPAVIRFAGSLFELRLLAQGRGWDRNDGPRAVLACAPREERTLGLIAVGLTLAARHWCVVYLGAMTPARTLRATVREQQPELTIVSAERDDLRADERDDLRALDVRLIGRGAESLAASLGSAVFAAGDDPAAGLARRRSSRRGDATSPPIS